MSSTVIHNSLSNQITTFYIWLGWQVLRPKKSLVIPMQDRSRRSSLLGSLKCGKKCISSTTLITLFMENPSIKPSYQLTSHPRSFIPNVDLSMSEWNNSPIKFTTITQRPKDLIFTDIQFET